MKEERDDIEKLVLDNLGGLDGAEPSEGHFARFGEKLKNQEATRKINFGIIWRVAAIVVFVFLAVNQAMIYFSPKEEKITTLGSVSNEYREVEFYYTSSINDGLAQWDNFYKSGLLTEDDKKMMDNELNELDQVWAGLKDDLKANPTDERVINAMLEYYQNKLNVITLIIEKLREVKSQKEISQRTAI